MMGTGRRQLWSVTGFALLVFCAEAYQDEDHLTLPALNRVELDTMNQVKNEVFATAGIGGVVVILVMFSAVAFIGTELKIIEKELLDHKDLVNELMEPLEADLDRLKKDNLEREHRFDEAILILEKRLAQRLNGEAHKIPKLKYSLNSVCKKLRHFSKVEFPDEDEIIDELSGARTTTAIGRARGTRPVVDLGETLVSGVTEIDEGGTTQPDITRLAVSLRDFLDFKARVSIVIEKQQMALSKLEEVFVSEDLFCD